MVISQMTLDEKIQMVHGAGWGVLRAGTPLPPGSNFGAGFMAGIPRLGIPNIDLADSAVGVRMAAYQSTLRDVCFLPRSVPPQAGIPKLPFSMAPSSDVSCARRALICPSAAVST